MNTAVNTAVDSFVNVVDTKTDLGDMVYPFLSGLNWQIRSRPMVNQENIADLNEADIATIPTLRWVKDGQVSDLFVPGMDADAFWAATGLRASMHKGGYVFSKRLGRLLRPFRYWAFFDKEAIDIDHNPQLAANLWDGCGLMSRHVVERMAEQLNLSRRHRRELHQTRRFEVTIMHEGGQEKGDVLVVDDLLHDFEFPAGSAKTEITLNDGRTFVGLTPRHSHDEMRLDIQSLINLYPFFDRVHLNAWMRMEGTMFLQGMKDAHDLKRVMKRLFKVEDAENLAKLGNWHVGEYLASGGNIMWFAGMVKAVGKGHIKRLIGNLGRFDRETGEVRKYKMRFPIPGGRFYIFPAAVGRRDVPAGHVELDPYTATAWVNDNDWLDYIVDVLGGCDGDDALWVFPFADKAENDEHKILLWRSPNQLGELVVLQPTQRSHEIVWDIPHGSLAWGTTDGKLAWPQMDSRKLPARIDTVAQAYNTFDGEDVSDINSDSYSVAAMKPTVVRTLANANALGAFCNMLMISVLTTGGNPAILPARLENVIDATVKTGGDLTAVQTWLRQTARDIAASDVAVPQVVANRLMPLLDKHTQGTLTTRNNSWLDLLATDLDSYISEFWFDVEALALEACPPIAMFEQGRPWLELGRQLRGAYARVFREALTVEGQIGEVEFARAEEVTHDFLAQWPVEKRDCILLGAAAHLYSQGPVDGEPVRDQLLWQLGQVDECGKRQEGIAHLFIQALRDTGLMGQPMWQNGEARLDWLFVPERACPGTPVIFNGVWFNYHRLQHPDITRMSLVPVDVREKVKAKIASMAETKFTRMVLTMEDASNGRLQAVTEHGNVFGYVAKNHMAAANQHETWKVAWATAVDGNINAILLPVDCEDARLV